LLVSLIECLSVNRALERRRLVRSGPEKPRSRRVHVHSPVPFDGRGIFTKQNTRYYSHVPVSGGKVSGTLGNSTNQTFASISSMSVVTPLPHFYRLRQ
jgi:hypothetical protein